MGLQTHQRCWTNDALVESEFFMHNLRWRLSHSRYIHQNSFLLLVWRRVLKDDRIFAESENRNDGSCGNRMTIIKFVAPLIHAFFCILCIGTFGVRLASAARFFLSWALFYMIAFQRVTLGFNSRLDYSRHYRVSSQRKKL